MNFLLETISWTGIIFPLVLIFLEKDKEKYHSLITGYFLLFGIISTLKFFFGPSRDYIDPFEFPSMHMGFASLLMFFYPNIFTLLFAILIGESRIILGLHRGIDVVSGFVCAAFVYFIIKLVKDRRIRRQFVHLGLSMFFAFLLYINRFLGMITLLFFLIMYFFTYNKSFVRDLNSYFGRGNFDYGTINLLLGLLIVSIFWKEAWIAAVFLAWVDSLPSIFGYSKNSKSLIGFVGGLIGSLIATFVTKVPLLFAPIIALVELLSPTDDNLVIPISVWITYLLYSLLL